MKEIIEKLNNLKIIQTSIDFIEDLPEELAELFKECREDVLDVYKHRWYETSISVYKVKEGLLGVRSITDVVGEQNCVKDMYHTLNFFEVEEVPSVTYKIKK